MKYYIFFLCEQIYADEIKYGVLYELLMDPIALARRFYSNEIKDSQIYQYLGIAEKDPSIKKKLLDYHLLKKSMQNFGKNS